MIKYSHAKVNLALDIIGKNESGYHELRTIMQTIPLMDDIDFYQTPGNGKFNIKFRGDEAQQIDPENNTVASAIKALSEKWEFKNDYEIVINKNIPIAAGLGGGSSNAATTITALNSLEVMTLAPSEMREIGAKIGMDVPFFIEGESAYGTHFGEKIEVLDRLNVWSKWGDTYKALIIPKERQLTKDAFKNVVLDDCGKDTGKTDEMLQGFTAKNDELIFSNFHNDFEKFAGDGFAKIKSALNADHVMLCGSGTSVFALSSNPFDVKVLSAALPNQRILNLNR